MRQITYAGVLHTSPVERRSGTGKDKRTNVPPNVSSAGTECFEGETSLGIARKHSDGAPKAALRPEAKVSKLNSRNLVLSFSNLNQYTLSYRCCRMLDRIGFGNELPVDCAAIDVAVFHGCTVSRQ